MLESEDAAEINAKTEALQAAFHKVSEQVYAAARCGVDCSETLWKAAWSASASR